MRSLTLISVSIIFSALLHCSSSQSFNGYASCSRSRAANVSVFIHNFVSAMETLATLVGSNRWGDHVAGEMSPAPVYGLAQCFDNLSPTDCLLCFADCRTRLPRCLPSPSARIFLDGCFLRYDNYRFYEEFADKANDTKICESSKIEPGQGPEFRDNLQGVIKDVAEMALKNGGFATAERQGERGNSLYALAQCWRSLDIEGCRECLANAGRDVKGCFPSTEGRALNAGCFLRYSTSKFFDAKQNQDNRERGTLKARVIVAISASVATVALLSLFGACVGCRRWAKKRRGHRHLGGKQSTMMSQSGLNFKYEAVEKATNYFDASRKLGQGASGSVYKGTLSDGSLVAVKRLFFNTTQWVDEFFNEVNLLSGIEHKNLVKLLGCSIEGPESLLIYEYVPNKSLDHILFDNKAPQCLSWQQRFDIIVGMAEGLEYLHNGTETRIIHRDIKGSNILLDEKLNPKIADFGLVRGFAADKTHLSTGIAGTLGYMAPEYLVRGQLTEKADVYSFGVVILEIACSRKNTVYAQGAGSILSTVWRHFRSNTLTECIDPRLKGNFPEKQARDVLQTGLLCTQALVSLRPSMSEVVRMLTYQDSTIPAPKQPPFLNASVLEPVAPALSTIFQNSTSLASSSDGTSDEATSLN